MMVSQGMSPESAIENRKTNQSERYHMRSRTGENISIDCHICGREAKMTLETFEHFSVNEAGSTGVCGKFADRHISIFMDKVAFVELVHKLEPFWEWDDVSPEQRAAMMRWFLHDALEKLNIPTVFLWTPLDEDIMHSLSVGHHLNVSIACGDQKLHFQIMCDEKTYSTVLEKLNKLDVIQNPPVVPRDVSLGVCIDVINLPTTSLNSLGVGDAIVLGAENAYRSEDRMACRITYRGQTLQYGDLVGASLRLNGAISLDHGIAPRKIQGSQDGKAVASGRSTGKKSPDYDADVDVMFELAQLNVSLEELSNLGAGDVMNIGRTPNGIVDIIAQSRVIGVGKIVDLDGLAAVVVTELQS
jgi:flagellar motor switch/type III secretory pathway protein FliN